MKDRQERERRIDEKDDNELQRHTKLDKQRNTDLLAGRQAQETNRQWQRERKVERHRETLRDREMEPRWRCNGMASVQLAPNAAGPVSLRSRYRTTVMLLTHHH